MSYQLVGPGSLSFGQPLLLDFFGNRPADP